jgi:hypothetical protein
MNFFFADTLIADYYLYNTDLAQQAIGSSLAQDSGSIAYTQQGGAFVTATQINIQSSVGQFGFTNSNSPNVNMRTATRNDYVAFSDDRSVYVFRYNRTSLSWLPAGNVTTAAMFPFALVGGSTLTASNLTTIAAVTIEGYNTTYASIPTLVVSLLAGGVTSIQTFEFVPNVTTYAHVPSFCFVFPPHCMFLCEFGVSQVSNGCSL